MITTREVPVTFDEAAPRYDLMVALNPGYHRHLRAAAGLDDRDLESAIELVRSGLDLSLSRHLPRLRSTASTSAE